MPELGRVLIRATDDPPMTDSERDYKLRSRKGDVVDVRPAGTRWGDRETLPIFIRVTVNGTGRANLKRYGQPWGRDLRWSIVETKEGFHKIRLRDDRASRVATSERGAAQTEHLAHLADARDGIGARNLHKAGRNVIEIEVPEGEVDKVTALIKDRDDKMIRKRSHRVPAAWVDGVVAAGGETSIGLATFQSLVEDYRDVDEGTLLTAAASGVKA